MPVLNIEDRAFRVQLDGDGNQYHQWCSHENPKSGDGQVLDAFDNAVDAKHRCIDNAHCRRIAYGGPAALHDAVEVEVRRQEY